MNVSLTRLGVFFCLLAVFSAAAAPTIDPIGNANIPAGKSLIVPITASSPGGQPLTFTATSSTNRIAVAVHTNNLFWKMSVVQAAPANPPGSYQTPFRGSATTVTNVGEMTFMLLRDTAPQSVDIIQGLTMSGFYNSNTIFHRVVPGFVIQGGDPNTNGTGGTVFSYDDEFKSNALFSGTGQLALANSGHDSNGSQFFVTSGAQRALDFEYTIFGQLLRGFNVLTNILNTPTNGASRPLADVIITRASLVPDTSDTVITLTGTNLAGVSGTISIVADDGAGGRATNTFTATTVSDAISEPPFLNTPAVTNLIIPASGKVTNTISAFSLGGNPMYFAQQPLDLNTFLYSSFESFNATNGQFVLDVLNLMYPGPFNYAFAVSANTNFAPVDSETYTFTYGDTAISVFSTNIVAQALVPFTNVLIARFTNGVPNSDLTNFAASINWGDNSVTLAQLTTNLTWREVRAAHTYTNAGDYPIFIAVQSMFGGLATTSAIVSVPPSLTLARAGTNNIVTWPAWATAYQLQTNNNLASTNWATLSNYPALNGYNSVVTNSTTNGIFLFRLKK
jgi:peptidyl-prolyl cis-trans isomerase A (cyclophilin A)